MPMQKGTPNTPQIIIDETVQRHRDEERLCSLVAEYNKC